MTQTISHSHPLSHSSPSPFGSLIPNRSWSDASRVYRYGFNGKEKDFETSSDNYDFGARIYDGRLGRWLSVDPLMKKYADISSFVGIGNCPILLIDPDGKEVVLYDIQGRKVATFSSRGIIIEPGMENSSILQSYLLTRLYFSKIDDTFSQIENDEKILEIHESLNPNNAGFISSGWERLNVSFTDKKISNVNYVEYRDNLKIGKIEWNPNIGIIDAEGNAHSPAMILMHEMRHAFHFLKDLYNYIKRKYNKEEETFTINECNSISKKLGNNDGGNGDTKIRSTWDFKASFMPRNVTSNKKKLFSKIEYSNSYILSKHRVQDFTKKELKRISRVKKD